RARLAAAPRGRGRRGRAADRCRAGRVRAEAVRRVVGVALVHGDVLGRDAELLGDDLRERRLVALALRLDAELEDRLARRVNAQLGRVEHLDPEDVVLPARAGADDLRERGEADAEQFPLIARPLLLLAQHVVADALQRLVERRLVFARVVLEA